MRAALPTSPDGERRRRPHRQPDGLDATVFKVTLRRPDLVERTTFVREPRKLPVVLRPKEVVRLLDAAPGLKYKGSAERALRGGIARLRGGGAEGVRHRQQAHDHPRRARQRPLFSTPSIFMWSSLCRSQSQPLPGFGWGATTPCKGSRLPATTRARLKATLMPSR